MILPAEFERRIQDRWMLLSEEQRFLTAAGLYEAEKAILERSAGDRFSGRDRMEFVFYHMHGMTPEESVRHVPESVP